MKCDRCGKKAVVELKYVSLALCGACFSRLWEKRVSRVIINNSLLSKRDKLAVGVSGGKDSLDALYYMYKKYRRPAAVAIDEGIKGYRDKSLKYAERFCNENSIPLSIYSFKDEFGTTLDKAARKQGKTPCSLCGVWRRRLLNKAAKELGCSVIATGHNLDDECQSIVMNFFRGEIPRMARGGPTVGAVRDRRFVRRIKPLRECPEREDVLYALVNGIEYFDGECPYAQAAYRNSIRDALNSVEEKHPGTKFGILHSYDRMLPLLQARFSGEKIGTCERCGEPSAGRTCKSCQYTTELRRARS